MGERIGHRWPRRGPWLVGFVALIAALGLLVGCGGSGSSERSSTSARSTNRVKVEQVGGGGDRWSYARARFREMCAGCHTLRSAGAYGRRIDLDHDGGQNQAIRRVILDGEPGMPGWRGVISRRELEELVAFIVATARRDAAGDNNWHWQIMLRAEGERRRPGSYRFARGDKWAYAKARFQELCASCHTLAAANAHGRRFNLDRAGKLDPKTIQQVVLHGAPGMPTLAGVITSGELAEIAAFVSAVAKNEPGETNVQWEQRLRAEGDRWTPETIR